MGWWGSDVMSGDAPLDFLGDFADIMGLDYNDDNPYMTGALRAYALTAEGVRDEIDHMADHANGSGWHDDDRAINLQVLAVIVMAVGEFFPDNLIKDVFWAIDYDISHAVEFGWNNPDERIAKMRAFKKMIHDYVGRNDGVPTAYESEGLLDKIAQGKT